MAFSSAKTLRGHTESLFQYLAKTLESSLTMRPAMSASRSTKIVLGIARKVLVPDISSTGDGKHAVCHKKLVVHSIIRGDRIFGAD
ncbi:MAG: hypothetical protein V4455_05915 [Pseudomonadota bacterium]